MKDCVWGLPALLSQAERNEKRHDSKSSTKTSKRSFQHYFGTKPAVGRDCGPWFAIWLECGEEERSGRIPFLNTAVSGIDRTLAIPQIIYHASLAVILSFKKLQNINIIWDWQGAVYIFSCHVIVRSQSQIFKFTLFEFLRLMLMLYFFTVISRLRYGSQTHLFAWKPNNLGSSSSIMPFLQLLTSGLHLPSAHRCWNPLFEGAAASAAFDVYSKRCFSSRQWNVPQLWAKSGCTIHYLTTM